MQRTTLDYISVVEHHPDKRAIDRELRLLDPRLFLDPQYDPDFGRIVWTVSYHLGAGQPPLLIAEWRDPDTRVPLELSWGLWTKIKMREQRDPFKLRDEIKAENARREQERNERSRAAYEEIIRDVSPGRSMIAPPRGVYLRQSRSRLRDRGLTRL